MNRTLSEADQAFVQRSIEAFGHGCAAASAAFQMFLAKVQAYDFEAAEAARLVHSAESEAAMDAYTAAMRRLEAARRG